MSRPKFSIGIDLGTTNCAMAFVPLDAEVRKVKCPVPQWETLAALSESLTLPSFLYLPSESEAAQMLGRESGGREWISGRFARKRASESPGRVAHSAKSWLCHHAVDRSAPFLPWRSDEIPVEKRISPIQASALLLEYLRGAWDARFARDEAPFCHQEITLTVPASFDAVAQRLTLDAAGQAGFPDNVRLLEEPQAAFYHWLERHPSPDPLKLPEIGACRVVVIDIGGGTSDFSLFEISRKPGSSLPHIKRVAVSDHLLLGGDNIDLAIAHHVEPRLASEPLSPAQWNFLVAQCRDLKERCLTSAAGEEFPVSVPSQGSSLLGKTLTARSVVQKLSRSLWMAFSLNAIQTTALPGRKRALENGRCRMPKTAPSRVILRTFFATGLAWTPFSSMVVRSIPRLCVFGSNSRSPNGKAATRRKFATIPSRISLSPGEPRALEAFCSDAPSGSKPGQPAQSTSKSNSGKRRMIIRRHLSVFFPAVPQPKRSSKSLNRAWIFASTIRSVSNRIIRLATTRTRRDRSSR
jgi:hypothetical protein